MGYACVGNGEAEFQILIEANLDATDIGKIYRLKACLGCFAVCFEACKMPVHAGFPASRAEQNAISNID